MHHVFVVQRCVVFSFDSGRSVTMQQYVGMWLMITNLLSLSITHCKEKFWREHELAVIYAELLVISSFSFFIITYIHCLLEQWTFLFVESIHLLLYLKWEHCYLVTSLTCCEMLWARHHTAATNLLPHFFLIFSEILQFLCLLLHVVCQMQVWQTHLFSLCKGKNMVLYMSCDLTNNMEAYYK